MIGYHLAWEHNIIAMSMTQGRQRDVVYIGMAIKRMQVEPREAPVLTYAQSFYHKVGRNRPVETSLRLTPHLVDRARDIIHWT